MVHHRRGVAFKRLLMVETCYRSRTAPLGGLASRTWVGRLRTSASGVRSSWCDFDNSTSIASHWSTSFFGQSRVSKRSHQNISADSLLGSHQEQIPEAGDSNVFSFCEDGHIELGSNAENAAIGDGQER